MWSSRRDRDEMETCIACGDSIRRSDAREYDKYGDRWDRGGKEFEYLCKPCYRELCHQPRDELEGLLVEVDAGERDQEEFLQWYSATIEDRYGTLEEQ
jgi:hypothetical protein